MVHTLCASHAWHELTAIIVRFCTSSHAVLRGVTSLNDQCTQEGLHFEAVCQMCSAEPLAVHILDSSVVCGFNMNSELEVMVTLPGVQNCPLNCLKLCAKHNLH